MTEQPYYSHYLLSLDDFMVGDVSFKELKLSDISADGVYVSYMNKTYFVFFQNNVLNVQCQQTTALKSGLPYVSISIGEMAIAIHELYLQGYHYVSFSDTILSKQLHVLSPKDGD